MLNDTGKAYYRDQRLQKADGELSPFEEDTHRLHAQLVEAEDRSVASAVNLSPEDRALIAGFLQPKTREGQIAEYLSAIANDDPKTVATIESLPSSMSPLDNVTRKAARERKLAKASPAQREAIARLKHRIAAREHVASAARRMLKELAGAG